MDPSSDAAPEAPAEDAGAPEAAPPPAEEAEQPEPDAAAPAEEPPQIEASAAPATPASGPPVAAPASNPQASPHAPLRTETQGREALQRQRSLSGAAPADTTAALGFGAAGTTRLELRLQPTLILLNGRRLVSAPFFGSSGTDFVDLSQIPIQLIDRAEVTSGLAAGLYGEGAMGGVINYVTRRDIDGIDIELGGQATDKLDQGEADVAVLLGTGAGKTGANLMLSFFQREPLAARDRDWILERTDRVESLYGSPATFQQLTNFDYQLADPLCPVAERAGHATGYEVRLRGYGPPSNLDNLTEEQRTRFLTGYDQTRGLLSDRSDGDIDALQSPTYCAADYTGSQDLIIKDQRLQAYSTLWHALSDHTEVFGEAGYYRSHNENRTAAAFPLSRLAWDVPKDLRLLVPREHPDQPVESYGFATQEVSVDREANELFYIGRTQGPYNGSGDNERRIDVFRGVLGIQGDLAGLAPNSILSTWSWDVAGAYSTSELVASVHDTLLDKLQHALESCPTEKLDPDTLMNVPTTISDRQNAGCFNPFYNSVLNNAALDPLNVSQRSAQASKNGFITGDTDEIGSFGRGVQDGGYICDPNDPDSPPCPSVDLDGDGMVDPWPAGQPNTQEVIDSFTGLHTEYQQRTLATVDAGLRGHALEFSGGQLGFGLGAQYRRETLLIDYDQAYNERLYGFLFGGDNLDPVTRDVLAAGLELPISIASGVLELRPAVRIEAYDTVGVGLNGLFGVALRPFANSDSEPLRYFGLRGHVGYGEQAPTLTQLYGQLNDFTQVDHRASTVFLPHQISGNTELDFEKYTTISAGPMWDYAGAHVAVDAWMTFIDDVITSDNPRTLVNDCRAQFDAGQPRCRELVVLPQSDTIDHIESRFDNMAEVDTNGVDGVIGYTLDSKRRGLGDFGTFALAVQGTYINSYLIRGPRVLAAYYRDGAPALADPESFVEGDYVSPQFNDDGTRNYEGLDAEYEAAGFRNYENFAPPIPKLRFSIPLSWTYSGHTLGGTLRFIDGYFDDSEYTIEKRDLPGINQIQVADGEKISSWTVLDAMYALSIGNEAWTATFTIGVINLLDAAPPAAESPLGYEVGIHDPRGRTLYARIAGDF